VPRRQELYALRSTRRPLLRCGSPVFWSAAGALGIALVWLLTALV